MSAMTWFLTGWHWLYTAIAACLLFWLGYIAVGTARIVADWWQEHRDAPALDAYFDDVEDGYIDLPGPAGARPLITAGDGTRPAGELHYMDTWLGRPGDGSEHTALRIRREGEAMLARVEAARRELAAECGIRYVPMELVAA